MFTGIIEEIGTVKSLRRGAHSVALEITAEKVLEDTRIGDSIAVNGVCLTVTAMGRASFAADVMPETMSHSNLGSLRPGDRVNLERALCLNGRLGGHLVTGHVDGTGRIVDREQEEIAVVLTIAADPELLHYMVRKGSVAVDGVSLTVVGVDRGAFKVALIPHTQEAATLTGKRIGERVNVENDLIAKYVEKWMAGEKAKEGLSLEFLQANGF